MRLSAILGSWKTPASQPDRKCYIDRGLGNMSFEELLMDSLYNLLKIKPKREAHDVVYCDNIPIQKKWSQSPQFFPKKKYRSRWLVLQKTLSLGIMNTQLLKGGTVTEYPEVVDVFDWKILTKSLINLCNGLCTLESGWCCRLSCSGLHIPLSPTCLWLCPFP